MLENYKKFAMSHFGWLSDRFPDALKLVESTLPKSGMAISPRDYISMVFFTCFIFYLASLVLTSILSILLLKLNILLSLFIVVFIPFLVAVITFIVAIFYPYQRLLSRRKSILTNLPFAITHMGAIASSGVPPQAIFKLMSEFKEYDALAEEMEKITRNIEVFGLDPISAMKEVGKRTPCEKFKQLLFGLASTIESGGDLKTYLKNAGEQSLFRWRMKRQKYLQQLSSYAEFYTGLLIAAPLFLIALLSVMHMIQPEIGGFDILQLMKISIYLIIPALNIGFLIFLQVTEVEI